MMRLLIMWETACTGSLFIGHLNAGDGDTEKKPLNDLLYTNKLSLSLPVTCWASHSTDLPSNTNISKTGKSIGYRHHKFNSLTPI